ncbi:trigger factor [Rummeliibacillus sp. G93]|uniref:Trigger factor n=1 Tax=Rummeliibacillus stabekisii TaxID=241244 RepID=A0A143HDG6_9BACL|nr:MULTISPECIES: trigger factor [Rummeliibacillus]AMW99525.1 trigger factor [Rummeliibacillus stabekisii]MBB5168830.1 trigger factor [Rummeliibacillus stabekisii]MCM3316897.1 trigger factor [Rummeliibacillus stabekisii]UQW96400.1 trigger factor [Rummeliibacillus sp. G93]GEL05026.1 trigger factor [Rummeliibacillus stabekisii]
MSAKWEKQEGNTGVLTVELPAEKVNAALDKAFKKVVKQINVPGFRKGKMPRQMFEKRFGVESLYQDALELLVNENYPLAIDETGISPVDQPEIDFEMEDLGKNKDFKFTATVIVKPEVELGDYKGLEVKKQETTVTDEEIEQQLKDQQTRLAELVVKEDSAIENGDTAVIDFEGFQDGEAFEGGKGDNYSLEIGSGSFIPGFEEQLIGAKAGEEKEVVVTFPEEYHAAELAGKEATFKVNVKEVKGKELPELDDDFAQEVDSEVKTLDELRTKLKEKTATEKAAAADTALRDELVEKAANNAKIDIPNAMIETEIDRMMQEYDQNLQMQGLNLDLFYQFSGQDEAALRAQMKEDAESRVRVALVLEAIGEAEKIEATEEDINAELEKMTEQFKMDADQIKSILGGTSVLEHDVKIRKTVEFLVDNAKVTE